MLTSNIMCTIYIKIWPPVSKVPDTSIAQKITILTQTQKHSRWSTPQLYNALTAHAMKSLKKKKILENLGIFQTWFSLHIS